MSIQQEHFNHYFLDSCHIGGDGSYLFIARAPQDEPDPIEPTDFRRILYKNGKWRSKFVCNAIDLYGGYTRLPSKGWVVVNVFGAVMRVNEDDTGSLEDDISGCNILNKAKVVAGKMYAVSPRRKIWRRDAISKWTFLKNGLPEKPDLNLEQGFCDIDGFSENDIYAVGDNGDVWNWNGNIWHQIDVHTNTDIESVCCGGDGRVYLCTFNNEILIGKDNRWDKIEYDVDAVFRNMVWFKDRIYMGHGSTIYEIKDGEFQESNLNQEPR